MIEIVCAFLSFLLATAFFLINDCFWGWCAFTVGIGFIYVKIRDQNW